MESQLRLAERRGKLQGDLSPIQHMALEMVMALDLMAKAKAESIDLRLKLLPLDPDRVRGWFPEWFNRTQTLMVDSEEDIERVIEYELGGTATEFVSGPTGEITAEGVEALLKSLASGTATLGPENDWQ